MIIQLVHWLGPNKATSIGHVVQMCFHRKQAFLCLASLFVSFLFSISLHFFFFSIFSVSKASSCVELRICVISQWKCFYLSSLARKFDFHQFECVCVCNNLKSLRIPSGWDEFQGESIRAHNRSENSTLVCQKQIKIFLIAVNLH